MALTLAQMIGVARSEVTEVSATEACKALNDGDIELILDVREPDEYRDGHLPEALNIPRGLLEIRADTASPVADPALSANVSGRVLVYCTKNPGARSLLAAQTLAQMGYEDVEVLGGGLVAWAESGLPVESERQPASA
jgi:rhodanese-related sulfurtransferase